MPFATYDSQIITCRPYSYSDRSAIDSVESQADRAGRLAACQLFARVTRAMLPAAASTAHVDMWSGCNVSFVLSRPLHANGEYRIAVPAPVRCPSRRSCAHPAGDTNMIWKSNQKDWVPQSNVVADPLISNHQESNAVT